MDHPTFRTFFQENLLEYKNCRLTSIALFSSSLTCGTSLLSIQSQSSHQSFMYVVHAPPSYVIRPPPPLPQPSLEFLPTIFSIIINLYLTVVLLTPLPQPLSLSLSFHHSLVCPNCHLLSFPLYIIFFHEV